MEIKCDTPDHHHIERLAWLAIFLYPFGWMLVVGVLLWSARDAILGRSEPTTLSKALAFLYRDYKPEYFWWEVTEMFRRFFLVGLLSIIMPGSLVQISIAALFSILFMFLRMHARPFKESSDAFLASCDAAALAIIYMCSVLMKVGRLC